MGQQCPSGLRRPLFGGAGEPPGGRVGAALKLGSLFLLLTCAWEHSTWVYTWEPHTYGQKNGEQQSCLQEPLLAPPYSSPAPRASPQDRPWGEPGTCVWRLQAPLPRVPGVICRSFRAWICPVSWSLFTRPAQPTSGLTASRCSLPAVCRLRPSSVEPEVTSLRAWCGGMGTGWGFSPQPCRDWAGPCCTDSCSAPQCPASVTRMPATEPVSHACSKVLEEGPGRIAESTLSGTWDHAWACLCPLDPAPLQPGPDLLPWGEGSLGALASP